MLKQKIAIITLLLLTVTGVWAQQEPSFTHYWAMEPSFNPAAVGKQSKLNVTGAYAMTLTGFENAPKTMHFGADMPFRLMNQYHGVGLQLVNDQIGLFSHQRLMAQYAYKLRLFGGTTAMTLLSRNQTSMVWLSTCLPDYTIHMVRGMPDCPCFTLQHRPLNWATAPSTTLPEHII